MTIAFIGMNSLVGTCGAAPLSVGGALAERRTAILVVEMDELREQLEQPLAILDRHRGDDTRISAAHGGLYLFQQGHAGRCEAQALSTLVVLRTALVDQALGFQPSEHVS